MITKITLILIALNIIFISSHGQNTIDRSSQVNESYYNGLFKSATVANDRDIQVRMENIRNDWKGKGDAFEKLVEIDKTIASNGEAIEIDSKYEDSVYPKRSRLNELYHLRKDPYLIYPNNGTSMTILIQF